VVIKIHELHVLKKVVKVDVMRNNSCFVILVFLTGCFVLGLQISHVLASPPQGDTPSAVRTELIDTLTRELDEVIIEAFNRRQEIVTIPGALTSVGAQIIEREKPAVNVLPVFNFIPGVYAHQGAINTSRVVIRGTGARVLYATGKIRAYFNNIPLTNTSGITFIEDIDPAVLESMDVIKGPAPSVYGAGLGGTIIMNARRPETRTSGFSNTSQAGSFGFLRNASVLDLVRPGFSTSLIYSHTRSDGYRDNNEYRRDAVTSVSQFRPFANTTITTLFAFSDLLSHIPSSIDSVTYTNNPTAAAANWMRTRGYEEGQRFLGGITLSHVFNPQFVTHVSLFGLWHDELEMRPFDVFYEERYTLGARLRAVYGGVAGFEGVSVSMGGEAFRERYLFSNHENIGGEGIQGDPFSDNRETVNTYNVFAQVDGTFGLLNLSLGLNLNYSHRDYEVLFNPAEFQLSGVYDYGLILSPRLALGYEFLPSNSIYAGISHGFAPPSLAETLTPDGAINTDILPEKSWNLEFGFRGKLFDRKLFYDVSLYQMRVQDLLVAERVGEDAWVGRNAGESLHRGLESELIWGILKRNPNPQVQLMDVSLRSNFTYNHFRFTDFIDRNIDYSGNKIPGVPDYIFFSGLYAENGWGVYLFPSVQWIGPMQMNDANTRSTSGYFLTNIVVGYKPGFRFFNLDVFLRVNNMLNEKYASMILVNAPTFGNTAPRYYYPGLPVNYQAGIRITVPGQRAGQYLREN
jgi:iron complex outermembrane recepter protein